TRSKRDWSSDVCSSDLGRENAKKEVLHWMQCEEKHLNIPVYYNLLSNAALLVEAGMGCAVCLDGALSIHADPDLCFRRILPEHKIGRASCRERGGSRAR